MAIPGESLVERPVRDASAVRGLCRSRIVIVVIAGLVFDAGRLPGWLLDDPARLAPVVWIAAALRHREILDGGVRLARRGSALPSPLPRCSGSPGRPRS